MKKPASKNGAVSWRWLAVTAIGILILGGAGWMTSTTVRVGAVEREVKEVEKTTGSTKSDVEVIKERTRRQEQDTRELKQDVKELDRKIDELLRRTPDKDK